MTVDSTPAEALRRTYATDGSLVVRGVLDAALVADVSAHGAPGVNAYQSRPVYDPTRHYPFTAALP